MMAKGKEADDRQHGEGPFRKFCNLAELLGEIWKQLPLTETTGEYLLSDLEHWTKGPKSK